MNRLITVVLLICLANWAGSRLTHGNIGAALTDVLLFVGVIGIEIADAISGRRPGR